MSFAVSDRVAWHHEYATQHAATSVVYEDAVRANAPNVQFGTVVDPSPANEPGTYWTVLLDGDEAPRVLTSDELVKVA